MDLSNPFVQAVLAIAIVMVASMLVKAVQPYAHVWYVAHTDLTTRQKVREAVFWVEQTMANADNQAKLDAAVTWTDNQLRDRGIILPLATITVQVEAMVFQELKLVIAEPPLTTS